MGRALINEFYNMSFDWEAEKDREFGEWLAMRRKKANLKIDEASLATNIALLRLNELECGEASKGITEKEAIALAKTYGLDPRAIILRAINEI